MELKKTSEELFNQAIHLVNHFSTFLSDNYNIEKKPTSRTAEEAFKSLETDKQVEIVKDFNDYTTLCYDLHAKGCDLSDNKKTTLLSLKKLGKATTDSFMNTIDDGLIIEMYNLEGKQIYRNIHFYAISNYTVLDILVYDWQTLFERSFEVNKVLTEYVMRALSGKEGVVSLRGIDKVLTRERLSEDNAVFQVELFQMAPAYSGPEKIENFLCTSKGTKVGSDYCLSNVKFL